MGEPSPRLGREPWVIKGRYSYTTASNSRSTLMDSAA
jgi:hypothetical protein